MTSGLMHGGGLMAAASKFGGEISDWMDLSTGINPRPWPVPPLDEHVWHRLPEQESLQALEDAAHRFYRARPDQKIVAVPGTQALIELLPRLLPGDRAAVLSSGNGTYSEHAHCLQKAGKQVDMATNISDISTECDLAVLVHPNNPDGHLWDHAKVMGLTDGYRDKGGHVIVDEAFCDFVPEGSFVADAPANMIIYRSFGKFFGLAGLRLGFAICSKKIAGEIRKHVGPWPVPGPAIEIGRQAFEDVSWSEQTKIWLEGQSAKLTDVLNNAGMQIVGGHGLFVLASDPDEGRIATTLARQHILVRNFSDRPHLLRFGLPGDDAGLERLGTALCGSCLQRVG